MASIYLKYDTLVNKIRQDGIDDYKNWLNESINRLHLPIKYKYKNISPISFAIHCFKPDLIMWMLNTGVNKNGFLEAEPSYYSSISSIILIDVYFINFIRKCDTLIPLSKKEKKKIFCMKQIIFDLLVLKGADINLCGLNGKNLLALECSKPITLIDVKWIKYILTKGVNPNIFSFFSKKDTILATELSSWLAYRRDSHKINLDLCISWFFQPAIIIYWSMVFTILLIHYSHSKFHNFFSLLEFKEIKDWNISHVKTDCYYILSLLIFHGANIEQSQSDNRTLYQIIKWVESGKKHSIWHSRIEDLSDQLNFSYYWCKLNRPLSTIIKRCSKFDIPRLEHLKNLLKLGNANLLDYSNRKYLCDKITRNHKKILNNICYMNKTFSSICECTNKYSKSEIIEYKTSKNNKICIWAFHLSEIPNLIKTQINPFTREKINIDIIKNWYNILDKNRLPLHYPPLSTDEISDIDLSKPTFSQAEKTIDKDDIVLDLDLSDVKNNDMKEIFELYKDAPNMNIFNLKSMRKIRKKNMSISVYLEERKQIKIKKKVITKQCKLQGFGIFWKKYSNDVVLANIEKILNATSIGKYINLILWLNSWPYVLIFKLLFDLYIYNEQIVSNNWSIILELWCKRKSYSRCKMKKFFTDIFIFIVTNGLNYNTLNINILSNSIIELHRHFLYIKKLQKIIWKLYKNDILTTLDIIENANNALFDDIQDKFPVLFNEIIDTIKFDIDDIFNIGVQNLQITLHESPGFQYFETTLTTNTKHLAYFQWNLLADEDKEPFIFQGMQIKENTEFQVNKTWKYVQNLLFLINNEKFYHDL